MHSLQQDRLALIERKLRDLSEIMRGPKWRIADSSGGTRTVVGGGGHDGYIVLIDKDIDPIKEADPHDLLEAADVADAPIATGTAVSIPASNTIKLAADESAVDDFFNGDTIVVDGQTRTITDYVGSTQVATVDSNWSPTPSDLEYEISSPLEIIFQDPVPEGEDDNYDDNHVDSLDLKTFDAPQLDLKYYTGGGVMTSGTGTTDTSNTLKLDDNASKVDDFYNGYTLAVDGQSQVVTDYVGATNVATVADNWSPSLADFDYTITSTDSFKLVTTSIDDLEHMDGDTPAPRRIYRHATRKVSHLLKVKFEVGSYTKEDYPDYPENDTFPPTGEQTKRLMPDGYFGKSYRAEAKYAAGRYWLDMRTCEENPPPPLFDVEDE